MTKAEKARAVSPGKRENEWQVSGVKGRGVEGILDAGCSALDGWINGLPDWWGSGQATGEEDGNAVAEGRLPISVPT